MMWARCGRLGRFGYLNVRFLRVKRLRPQRAPIPPQSFYDAFVQSGRDLYDIRSRKLLAFEAPRNAM